MLSLPHLAPRVVLACALLGVPVLAGGQTASDPQLPRGTAPAIPEPAALALFVLGAGVIGVAIRRREE